MPVTGTGIEPIYLDFQSNALPLSYPVISSRKERNKEQQGIEPVTSVHETDDLPLIYAPKRK